MPGPIQVVIDTNVVVAAIKSNRGAAYKIINSLPSPKWQNNVSTALLCEYEEQANLHGPAAGLTPVETYRLLNSLSGFSKFIDIYFRWPDYVRDQDDRIMLDIAVAVRADYIITFNIRNFVRAQEVGIKLITPGEFLRLII
jgi:putative PIN family toxin of toxin-antitoxin system